MPLTNSSPGKWIGYFKYPNNEEKSWFTVFITFKHDGSFKGFGNDEVGPFLFKKGTRKR